MVQEPAGEGQAAQRTEDGDRFIVQRFFNFNMRVFVGVGRARETNAAAKSIRGFEQEPHDEKRPSKTLPRERAVRETVPETQ